MTVLSELRCRWARCASPGPYPDDHALFEHLQAAHNPPPKHDFTCKWQDCSHASRRPVRSRQSRAEHLLRHTNYRPHACTYPGCGKTFKRRCDAHGCSVLHDWSLVSAYPCLWVGCTVATFPGPGELRAHIENEHMSVPAAERDARCGWAGCMHAHSRKHIPSHFPASYKPYECTICSKAFKTASGLGRHAKWAHSNISDATVYAGDDCASAVAANPTEPDNMPFPRVKRAWDGEDKLSKSKLKRFKHLEGKSQLLVSGYGLI
ncbi:hypothetical protein AURDEDRAFT_125107 [Auricularia subglabra TFB-10046 SS5]|uniref:C2H2-type domain-containing protein n=1 Tax=Auricularia subglabra (strain TFB-10046 / SS5) TaxID=717982 RepID=J0LKI0_AURST|nr:hypothetical protein AURDEDRAFT_125107 [Auricularia subglabra TFB-10046 SS5]